MSTKQPLSDEPFFTLELDGQEVQRFALTLPRTSIGRARESEIQIAVRGVSRMHAVVLRDNLGNCMLKDLGSANGTYVNGARIPGEHPLVAGDVINFLDYALRFHREASTAGDVERIDTDAQKLDLEPTGEDFVPDDSVPTDEGPALERLRNQTITTEEGAPQRGSRTPKLESTQRWEVDVDDPELGRSTYTLAADVTVIGGEGAPNIHLSGKRLERLHSLFVRIEDKLLFVRLSPVHIARVNGTARMVSFLDPGDEISIGGSSLVVRKR